MISSRLHPFSNHLFNAFSTRPILLAPSQLQPPEFWVQFRPQNSFSGDLSALAPAVQVHDSPERLVRPFVVSVMIPQNSGEVRSDHPWKWPEMRRVTTCAGEEFSFPVLKGCEAGFPLMPLVCVALHHCHACRHPNPVQIAHFFFFLSFLFFFPPRNRLAWSDISVLGRFCFVKEGLGEECIYKGDVREKKCKWFWESKSGFGMCGGWLGFFFFWGCWSFVILGGIGRAQKR